MANIKQIGLGTAAIGRPQYINISSTPTTVLDLVKFCTHGLELLESAYQNGVRYFDTAPGYGMAEDMVIEWLKGKKDPEIEIATKWGYTYVADFDPLAITHEIKEHSISKLIEQWEVSKKLFPYLTTYQIHSADFDSKVLENKEVLHYLANLKKEYDIKIRITATGADQISVIKYAIDLEVNGEVLFDTYQVSYNILEQSLLSLVSEIKAKGKRLIIKEALANGRIFPNANYPAYQKMYITLQELSEKYNVGIDAIALRFCIDTINPYSLLSGAARLDHLESNITSCNFKLDTTDLAVLKNYAVDSDIHWQERKRLEWNSEKQKT